MTTAPARARDLGFPFSGTPGRLNAITDVPEVAVGYSTLWRGEGQLVVGEGPVRTGVTAILPRGARNPAPCFAASFALNAAGEMTGLTWLDERGLCEGPVLITNTHSVGLVRDTAIQWMRHNGWSFDWSAPIVGETYDGYFSDIDGGHIRPEHVIAALDSARSGVTPAEGNVGGGTGMSTYEYKGGTGTASRVLGADDGGYIVGVLVQSNFGERRHLRIGGLKMGEHLADDMPRFLNPAMLSDAFKARNAHWLEQGRPAAGSKAGDGSIIVIVATDAPLLPHQLKRLAKRPALAIGRLGGVGAATSGDIFIAMSTGNADISEARGPGTRPTTLNQHPNLGLTPLFEAVIDATEEAILNALVAGETAEGANRLRIPRLPHEQVRSKLRDHGLLVER